MSMRTAFAGRAITEVAIFHFESFISTDGAAFVSGEVRLQMAAADGSENGPMLSLSVNVPSGPDTPIADAERALLDCAFGVIGGFAQTTTDHALAVLAATRDRRRLIATM